MDRKRKERDGSISTELQCTPFLLSLYFFEYVVLPIKTAYFLDWIGRYAYWTIFISICFRFPHICCTVFCLSKNKNIISIFCPSEYYFYRKRVDSIFFSVFYGE